MRSKKMKKGLVCFSILALFALTVNASAQTSADPKIGKHLFRAYCLVCHGADGKSKGPLARKLDLKPADLTAERYRLMNTDRLMNLISGYSRKSASNMPVWGEVLPASNLRHLAAYIPHLRQKGLSFQGDARLGRAIFQDACRACHGIKGKGDGILAKLIGLPMMDFTDRKRMRSLSDEAILTTIRKGGSGYMPSWEGTLDGKEITDVAAYIRSLGNPF